MCGFLIPPRTIQGGAGGYRLPRRLVVGTVSAADQLPAQQLAADLTARGVAVSFVPGAVPAALTLRRNRALTRPGEYQLTVTPGGLDIVAGTDAGAYYGVQTLRELLRLHRSRLPSLHIEDWADFARRGVYHDCARGKVPSVETLKALVEQLAQWKINELQLYIENAFTFRKHPRIGEGYSPFTPADLLAVQAHCRRHHVRFVPSLASFGHMEKTLALPDYAGLGEMPGYDGLPGGTTLCPGDPLALRLMDDLYAEFLPLFESEDFNLCGDEPWELGRGRSKRRAARVGVGRVYLDFVLKLRQLAARHGKRVNLWGDIVLQHPETISAIPKDLCMLNWDYAPDGQRIPRTREFREAGLPVVCCPGTHAWQSHGTRLQTALDNVAVFARVARENDAEGLLNTDWGDFGHRNTLGASLCSFAHGAAHAWHTQGVEDARHVERFTFHTFDDRDGSLADRLRVLGAAPGRCLYRVLVEALDRPASLAAGFCGGGPAIERETVTDPALQAHADRLCALRWAVPAGHLPPFLATALREYALAADMDRLAMERLGYARRVRAGDPVPARALLQHAEGLQAMSLRFAALWRLRNKPSRLRDNLVGFRAAARNARQLAGRT